MKSKSNNKTLPVFVHIPKVAGSSVKAIARLTYPEGKFVMIKSRATISIVKDYLQQLETQLTTKELSDIDFLGGHLAHLLNLENREVLYFSFFRDPLKHFLSGYRYIKYVNHDNRFHYLLNDEISSPDKYLDFVVKQRLDNPQTRCISEYITHFNENRETLDFKTGKAPLDSQVHGQYLLDKAVSNLNEKYGYVFLTERFDEGIIQLSKVLNWEKVPFLYKKVKDSTNHQVIFDDYGTFLEKFNYHYSLDINLYRLVKERYNKQVLQFGEQLEHDVNIYHKKKKLYTNLYSIYQFCYSTLSSIKKQFPY